MIDSMSVDQKFINELFQRKYESKNINLCRDKMEQFVDQVIKILFPALCNQIVEDTDKLRINLEHLGTELQYILSCLEHELHTSCRIQSIVDSFYQELPKLEHAMNEDAQFILNGDPAAKSLNEVVLCYPGFYAIGVYRIAHFFQMMNIPLFPRILTEYAHNETGIDIHPGAKIDYPFFIDHGTGVVIGETCEIGKRVKIYQGVTLGAKSVDKSMSDIKRHPTIEDDCVLYANATILGGDTIIKRGTVIGGNEWITKSL
jgi:serine O-acetyltransferase